MNWWWVVDEQRDPIFTFDPESMFRDWTLWTVVCRQPSFNHGSRHRLTIFEKENEQCHAI
jgi:hypothetical protein